MESQASPSPVQPAKGNPAHILKAVEIARAVVEEVKSGDYSARSARDAWEEWRKTLTEPLDLSGADFSALVPMIGLIGFGFGGAVMVGVNMRGMTLGVNDFKGTNLQGADFSGAEMTYMFFDGANLEGASFVRARVEGGCFEGANLKGADFSDADLWGPSSDESTDLTGARFHRCRLLKFKDGSGGEMSAAFRKRLSPEQQQQLAATPVKSVLSRVLCKLGLGR
jgi:uncharacterized protein YjbI with pentapeptide repeats